MINIFVTYRCNLSCRYCFARELGSDFPEDMQPETFDRLLAWMAAGNVASAGFIGGEPTLHPRLAEMIESAARAGIAPVLFTNGLFEPTLADRLAGSVANFVVNYNDPRQYTGRQRVQLHLTLSRLSRAGARLTFSKNFAPQAMDYDYFLEGAARYGAKAVRYDISRPSGSRTNDFFDMDEYTGLWDHILAFTSRCEAQGLPTGLDCCVKLCEVPASTRRYLEQVSVKFTGICHPSMDVHPDLSASYCLPMHHLRVPDVTAFSNPSALMRRFAELARPRRFENTAVDCADCAEFKRRCQGGCMALRIPASPAVHFETLPDEGKRANAHGRV